MWLIILSFIGILIARAGMGVMDSGKLKLGLFLSLLGLVVIGVAGVLL